MNDTGHVLIGIITMATPETLDYNEMIMISGHTIDSLFELQCQGHSPSQSTKALNLKS